MSGTKRPPFTLISEEEIATQPPEPQLKPSLFTAANANILLVSLRALSQRTAMEVARFVGTLFTVGLVASVWLLVSRILSDPTKPQLVALAGYAAFCLMIDVIRRRK
jgi:hypothetical protein